MELTFDVVIPTVRLDLEKLGSLLTVHRSVRQARVVYYVVVDAPEADLGDLRSLVAQRADVTVLINAVRLGAHGARNRGIEIGTSDLILLLDDDVVPSKDLLAEYARAIEAVPDSPGYVGVTRFPQPTRSFTRGIVVSDILTFFDLAASRPNLPWGVTANLCLRRSALAGIRFSSEFPKGGGGEDIDLCLRVMHQVGRPFLAVPDATVEHPWWPGRRSSYKRFFRWAFGDSRLPALHPGHRYWNAPSLPESALLLLILMMMGFRLPATATISLLLLLLSIELVVDLGRLLRRKRGVSLGDAVESTVIRLSNDLGRLVGNVARARPWGLFERFDYFCDGQHIAGERRVAIVKTGFRLAGVMITAWLST